MAFDRYDPARPVRVRLYSPHGFYPRHAVAIPGACLVVRDDLIVSAVQTEPLAAHWVGETPYSELEFLALEETRFLAAIALSVHPDDGMAVTYPLCGHVDVALGLDDEALLEAAQHYAAPEAEHASRGRTSMLPPRFGGPAYRWRDVGVDVGRVLEVARATQLNDHILIRGLGALLRADMCWQHHEIAEAAVMQLYVALDASFQMVLRTLREQGVTNPSGLDAGALIAEVFNPALDTGSYFEEYYEDRIKTMHPSSRFGVFGVAPLAADNFYHLRHGLIEVYCWLITKKRLAPA